MIGWYWFCLLCPVVFSAWTWSSVPVGGGGYVLNILIHPLEKDLIYSRTDVGGIYRWDNNTWVPLTERFNVYEKNLYGGESIAIDPRNPDIIYHAAGMYSFWGTGDIFKSSDRGLSWQSLGLHLMMGGNENYRWGGERLVVDPLDSNNLFFGSRFDGLWRYNGLTWSYVSSIENGTYGLGILFVTFDPSVKGPQSRIVYAGVTAVGVYKSVDGGNTWRLLNSSPKNPLRGVLATDNSLYVSATDGIYRILPDMTVKNITPPNTSGCEYSAIAVDPVDSETVFAGEHCNAFWCSIWVSKNGGQSWSFIVNGKKTDLAVHKSNVPWWPDNYFSAATASIAIDPFNRTRLWFSDWFGTWITDDYTQTVTHWYTTERGHEEVFGLVLHCPVGGGLLSGTADVDGFKHTSVDQYPLLFAGMDIQDTTSIDSSELSPQFVVRAGTVEWNNTGAAGFSHDGGATFYAFPRYPVTNNYNLGGEIAVTSDISTIIWRPFLQYAYYSLDQGKSWTMSKGSPISPASCCHAGPLGINVAYSTYLATDRVNAKLVYIYDKGSFYLSNDAGISFSVISKIPDFNEDNHVLVVPMSGQAGDVWVSLDNAGLWHSPDAGKTFTKVPGVDRSMLITFGKAAPGKSMSLYVMGTISGTEGIFASYDLGQSWTNIQDPKKPIGDNPWSMCADRSVFGQVYIGTLGRGIYYSSPN